MISIGKQISMNVQLCYHIVWNMLTVLTLMVVTCAHVTLATVEMDSTIVTVRQIILCTN